jgi:hypothetical protein
VIDHPELEAAAPIRGRLVGVVEDDAGVRLVAIADHPEEALRDPRRRNGDVRQR